MLIIACPCALGFGYPMIYNGWRWVKVRKMGADKKSGGVRKNGQSRHHDCR